MALRLPVTAAASGAGQIDAEPPIDAQQYDLPALRRPLAPKAGRNRGRQVYQCVEFGKRSVPDVGYRRATP